MAANYGRQTWWNRDRCMTSAFGDRIGGLAYDEELAGPGGCHIHFWVPRGISRKELHRVVRLAQHLRDLVSWSWDYEPGGLN